MRKLLSFAVAVGMGITLAGCQIDPTVLQSVLEGPPGGLGGPPPLPPTAANAAKSKFDGMGRSDILSAAAPGDSLADITRHMPRDRRDIDRSSGGLRLFFYAIGWEKDRFAQLCFKGDILVGTGQGMCEHVTTQFANRQAIEDELAYMREYHRNRNPRIDLARLPAADPSKAGFVLAGVRLGGRLSEMVPPCSVRPEYREQDAKGLTGLCGLEFLPLEFSEVFNASEFGIPAQVMVDSKGGLVERIAFMSKRYESKNFSRELKDAIVARFGQPAFYEEMQVGDSRGRFNLKIVA